MDKSSYDLLAHLIRLQEPVTVMAISRDLGQSRRKIYYQIDKINSLLPSQVPPIESLPRVGIMLSECQKDAAQQLMQTLDSYQYVMNMTERMQLMMVYICITSERITIEKLMELTEVSRNTVLNDLNEIRAQLAKNSYQMTLYVSKSQGYDLACHPLNKMQYMHTLLNNLLTEASAGFLQILETKVAQFEGCQQFFSPEITQFLSRQVPEIEKGLSKKINPAEIAFMLKVLPYLLLSYHNTELDTVEKEAIVREFNLVYERIEYRVAQQLQESLEKEFGLVLDEIEVSLIAILLLSYRKDRDGHVNSQDFVALKKVVDLFIDDFEKNSSFVFEDKEELAQNLLAHCKALLFRKAYGILSKNPLTKQIRDKYQSLFQVTRHASRILEEAWHIVLSDEDLAYLTVHMGGALRRTTHQRTSFPTIFIICDEGISVQRLLIRQCQQYLPDKIISAVFTTEQFKSVEDLLEVEFLISTNEALETHLPLVQAFFKIP